jgi:hypothetical protein
MALAKAAVGGHEKSMPTETPTGVFNFSMIRQLD